MIDRKFEFTAINPVNKKEYNQENAFVFCAKDEAVPAALDAYVDKCRELGANKEHIESVILLRHRVLLFQDEVERRVPDTLGAEIPRSLHGVGEDE